MNVLLFPVGSHGDVHPFLGMAIRLQQRGHRATLATSGLFQELVERCGVTFRELGDREEAHSLLNNPDVWHPLRAAGLLARKVITPLMHEQFEAINELATPDTVLVGSALGFGVRLAHEVTKLPYVSLHLQPAVFWSTHQSPQLGRFALLGDRVPRFLKEFQYRLAARVMFDRHLKKNVNAYRRELGLSPVRSAVEMFHSPQSVCAMFPEWFAPRQIDWPEQTEFAGFPLWDEKGYTAVAPELEDFLRAGEPPIVFTPGTAHTHADRFWKAAIDACQRLGRRGMLLTRHAEQIPSGLPEGVRHFDFAPFSQVLPQAAAIAHHGGIGTLSQGLAAGIPQVIMPMSHDQPDNAKRARRLGVGEILWASQFKGARLAKVLDRLLASTSVAASCAKYKQVLSSTDGIAAACRIIEAAARR
jgi:rhamnosyltransferase subunit B